MEGERLLLRVVDQADETWTQAASRALEQHYLSTGQQDRLRHLRARLDEHDAALRGARRERSSVRPGDRFLVHDLSDLQIEPLLRLLEAQPDCAAAWLVRKDLQFFPKRPLFVLCVVSESPGWLWSNSRRDEELVRRLGPKVELPGQVLVITRQGGFRKLAATIMSRRDSQVYRRKPGPAPLASAASSLSL